MSDNATHLRALMAGAGITREEAARLLYTTKSAIDAYLRPPTSKAARPVPSAAVELLAFKTGQALPEVEGASRHQDAGAIPDSRRLTRAEREVKA